jgi:hypothetical protein
MFGSWFGKAHEHPAPDDASQAYALAGAGSVPSLAPPPAAQAEQPTDGYFSPHDAILAQLEDRRPAPSRTTSPISPSRKGTFSTFQSTAESHPTHQQQQQHAPKKPSASDAQTAPASAPPEPIYDPFTGHLLGTLRDPEETPGSASAGADDASAAFDAARDALWAHLSRIRTLQADVAGLHVSMDGAALGEGARRHGPGRRVSSTVGGAGTRTSASASGGDWEEDEEDEEAERRREREGEFGKLASRFEKRKEAVDGVMGKVCYTLLCERPLISAHDNST